jgi:uncharacterized membrane protein
MIKYIKVIHIVGMVFFFGSILGHALEGIISSINNTLILDKHDDVYIFTIPGLIMLTLSGIIMAFLRKESVLISRWLLLHVCIGIIILLNVVVVLYPLGNEIALISSVLDISNESSVNNLNMLKEEQKIFGSFNIIACFVMIFIAVVKPKLGGK